MPTPLSLHASLTNLHRVALIRLIVIAGQLGGILFARLWLQADMDYTALLTGVALLGLLTAYTFWRLRGSEDVSDGEFAAHLLCDIGILTEIGRASCRDSGDIAEVVGVVRKRHT